MPDVTVTYNQGSNSIGFAPNSGTVDMPGPGTITFSQSPRFTYKSLTITAADSNSTPVSQNFSWGVDANGDMVVNDVDAGPGTYNYCLTITVDGNDVSSDPQIINKV